MSDRDDIPRTVFAPSPGNRNAQPRQTAVKAEAAGARRFGVNPLVDAAGELLELAVYLRGQSKPMNVEALQDNVKMLLNDFERRARTEVSDPNVIGLAHYALCATIDDVVLASPWGIEAGWQRNTLVSELHGEVTGGEKFFDIVKKVQHDSKRSRHLLELAYICISLGFRGRYRRDKQSLGELEQIRDNLFHDVDRERNGLTEVLSVRWRGQETSRVPKRAFFPVWLIAAVSTAACALLFIGVGMLTSGETSAAIERVGALPPEGRIEVVETPSLAAVPPPLAEPPPAPAEMKLRGLLQDLIDEGVIDAPEAVGSGLRIRVRSVSPGRGVMFASGKAEVQPRYQDVLKRITEALTAETRGDITVMGHSDLQPMANRGPYYNNKGLSAARARNAATVMAESLVGSGRAIYFDGIGEGDPIDTGTTREAHARNRRIDIMLPTQSPPQQEAGR